MEQQVQSNDAAVQEQTVNDEFDKLAKSVEGDVRNLKADFVSFVERYISTLREEAKKTLEDPEASPAMKEMSARIEANASLLEDGDSIFEFMKSYNGSKRLDSMTFIDHQKMRSALRRAKVVGLEYPETMKILKEIPDEIFRKKMICLFNGVLTFASESDKGLAYYGVFVKLYMLIIRSASRLRLTPALAAKLYEMHSDL